MRKKHQIVLIETEKYPAIAQSIKAKAFGLKQEELYGWIDCPIRTPHTKHHLYILSDDEVKEGDWYLNLDVLESDIKYGPLITKCEYKHEAESCKNYRPDKIKKIIATTNPELHDWRKIEKGIEYGGFGLPKLPQDFIERYVKEWNKGNIIKEVMLEYICNYCDPEESMQHCITLETMGAKECMKQVKLRSNNTVICHPVEERKYSKDELVYQLNNILNDILCNPEDKVNKRKILQSPDSNKIGEFVNKFVDKNL